MLKVPLKSNTSVISFPTVKCFSCTENPVLKEAGLWGVICDITHSLEASRGPIFKCDVETWRLKGQKIIWIQISEFKIRTWMHHEVPVSIPALCSIGFRVYELHLNASCCPGPCAAQRDRCDTNLNSALEMTHNCIVIGSFDEEVVW